MKVITPEHFIVDDDGTFPNSHYPVLVYHNVFAEDDSDGARWLEKTFAANNWTNSWRNGVYPFHHYHSTSHEVLGIYGGKASLQLGGDTNGKVVMVQRGDVVVIPAGVVHKNMGSSADFGVVGAYPDGRHWDLLRGEKGERPKADETIKALPIPSMGSFGW